MHEWQKQWPLEHWRGSFKVSKQRGHSNILLGGFWTNIFASCPPEDISLFKSVIFENSLRKQTEWSWVCAEGSSKLYTIRQGFGKPGKTHRLPMTLIRFCTYPMESLGIISNRAANCQQMKNGCDFCCYRAGEINTALFHTILDFIWVPCCSEHMARYRINTTKYTLTTNFEMSQHAHSTTVELVYTY